MEENRDRRRVVVFTMDAGGGHRAAANALLAAAAETGAAVELDLVSVADVLAPLDLLRRATGESLEDRYNAMVRRGRTRHLVPLLRVFQAVVAAARRPAARCVARFLRGRAASAVVSVAPNLNAIIRDGVRDALPGVPFGVVLTDYADLGGHFWMEPGLDVVVVATSEAEHQARTLGLPTRRTSGMILHPRFHGASRAERRRRMREELGLGDAAPVALLLFGGKGAPEMEPLARCILHQAPDWRVVAVCGDNPALHAAVAEVSRTSHGRLVHYGFTDRVADLMAACDLLVTKPGPGSLAEARHMGVPVVVCGNERTIPQERFNVRMVEREGWGLAARDWMGMAAAVGALAGDPRRLREMAAVARSGAENRAVYEVLHLLEELAGVHRAPARRLGEASLPALTPDARPRVSTS